MKIAAYRFMMILALTYAVSSYAQVGIGTTSPKSRLDVPASNSAAPEITDGLLIPRIDVFPSIDPGADQDGMLVFLTTTSGSNEKGFYYWDDTPKQWAAYNDEWADGTGSGGDNLIFGKQAGAGGVDVTVLDNGRIGMGTDDPEESLELKLDGDNDIQISSASPADSPQLIFYTTKGTFDSPDYLREGDDIGFMTGKVWAGGGKSGDVANMQFRADADHNSGNLATRIEFAVTSPSDTSLNSENPEFVIDGTGNIGIGLNDPSAVLEIKAGRSSANSAPLKFSSGNSLSTPEAGAVEYDGTNLYFTPSATRKILLKGLTSSTSLNFPNMAAGSTAELNVTVTGATTGSSCSCAPDNGIENGLQWSCYVSSNNTVTVRVSNVAGSSVNPASRNWKVTVIE